MDGKLAGSGRVRSPSSHHIGASRRQIRVIMSVLKWLFARLPLAFSLPFALISLWWMLSGFRLLDDELAEPAARSFAGFLESQLPGSTGGPLASSLGSFLHAVLVIALFLIGFLIAYNTASFVNWVLVAFGLKPIHYADGPPQIPQPGTAPSDPLAQVNRIGLVLAGGG